MIMDLLARNLIKAFWENAPNPFLFSLRPYGLFLEEWTCGYQAAPLRELVSITLTSIKVGPKNNVLMLTAVPRVSMSALVSSVRGTERPEEYHNTGQEDKAIQYLYQ